MIGHDKKNLSAVACKGNMNTNGNNRGLVLVAVLWLVVVLMTIVAVASRTSRLDTKVAVSGLEQVRCKWAGRAGIEKAIAVLIEDANENTIDSLTDSWSDNDTEFNDVSLEQCRFSVRVADEAGKLNINTITRDQLMALPYMEDAIADAIIDWRDEDETPTGEGVEGGYYENLPFRYTIRNGPFRTIRELLLVRGVTEELFYGEDTNFNGKLDWNERDGDASPPADDGDDKLDKGWIEYLTCYSSPDSDVDAEGNPRVNINSADAAQLEQSLGITRAQAQWIVQRRSSSNFQSIADLLDGGSTGQSSQSSGSSGGSDQGEPIDVQTFIQIADKITVGSQSTAQNKININTASEEVLTVLLGGTDADWEVALGIVGYRASLSDGMQSIGELLNVSSMTVEIFKRIAENITTRSNVFTVRCVATADRNGADGTTVLTEAVVDRSQTPSTMPYWYQGAGN